LTTTNKEQTVDKSLVEAFPPGEILARELDARHWSQIEFAEILDRPTQFVSEIVAGKKEITRESAAQIGAALGTSAESWLNLQNSYLLWKHRQSDSNRQQLDAVRRRARLNELGPIAILKKRGIVTGDTIDELEKSVMELFELDTIDDDPKFWIAARRSNANAPLTPTQSAWLASGRRQARKLKSKKYDKTRLEALAGSLAVQLNAPSGFEKAPELFAAVGVRLVYVEAFPGSKMSGAAFLLDFDPLKPVIALSGRGKRLDKVLFTLLHEVAHLLRGDVSPEQIVVDEDPETLGDEAEADKLAAGWATPGGLSKPPTPVRSQWVADEAKRLGVNPVVVIGQLQNQGLLDWRTQLVRDAPNVTEQLATWHINETRLSVRT
jgi:HTH-type transcriptional regulator/antitoxin HigA